MAVDAEDHLADDASCRHWQKQKAALIGFLILSTLAMLIVFAPLIATALVCGIAILIIGLDNALKCAAVVIHLRRKPAAPVAASPVPMRLPVVTLLVPLFHESGIAAQLLGRLGAIDYPHDRLDICLILEDEDTTTRDMLADCALPPHIRVIEVPEATLRTKPRALNYAINYARGSIIGIYDAEDAPAPDQLRRVVQHFAERGRDVACLQGALDYYNANSNWMARCFTLEYATWFRIILPGLERMGLVIPLGGTTLFLRRQAIEEVGGWDAHNVTEDADLGIRLARYGFRTEIIDSTTYEEACARPWPWVRQRSRWLKGYAMTYAVHMRHPLRLLRDLGLWRFAGLQLQFLGTLVQVALAPVIWSFWLISTPIDHPLESVITPALGWALLAMLLSTSLLNITCSVLAAKASGKRFLIPWVPTQFGYFPLATLAVYKALWELISRPFYWDKTTHGVFEGAEQEETEAEATAIPQPLPLPHQASIA